MNMGFTLIELVVVICIVAVLAAVLLPRVQYLQREARIGHLNGARGAVHSSAMLIHSALLTRGGAPDAVPCAGGGGTADNSPLGRGSVCTEHGLVRTQHGYPASLPPGQSGIVAAAGIGSGFNPDAASLRSEGYAVTVAAGVTTVSRADAPNPAACSFTYTEPPVARTAASISQSVISGC